MIIFKDDCYVDTETGEILKVGVDYEMNKKVTLEPGTVLWFGRYVGKSIEQVHADHPEYISYLYDSDFSFSETMLKRLGRDEVLDEYEDEDEYEENAVEDDEDYFPSVEDKMFSSLRRSIDDHMFEKHGESIFTDEDGYLIGT